MSTETAPRVLPPYRVEPDGEPCRSCGHGTGFVVVGPDKVALGVTYDLEEEAEEQADALNDAYAEARRNAGADLKAALEALMAPTWLVWSNEHRAWWGPNRGGYTTLEGAGRYSFEDAHDICRRANYRGPDARKHEHEGMPSEVMVPSPEWMLARNAAIVQAEGQ